MRLLDLPIPVIAAVIAPQIEPPEMSTAAWVAAIVGVAYVLLSYLNWIGRLPGAAGERRVGGFGDDDRARLTEMHAVVTREDVDKPGWRMVWYPARETREIRNLLIELSDLREDWEAEREEWQKERARMEARITHLEEVNRIQEHALEARGGGL